MCGLAIVVILFQVSYSLGNQQCYSCDEYHDQSNCDRVTTCPQDQMCSVQTVLFSGGSIPEYRLRRGCYNKQSCVAMTGQTLALLDQLVGKRSVGCAICCGNNMCNQGDCRQLEHMLYTKYKAGLLNLTTLEYS